MGQKENTAALHLKQILFSGDMVPIHSEFPQSSDLPWKTPAPLTSCMTLSGAKCSTPLSLVPSSELWGHEHLCHRTAVRITWEAKGLAYSWHSKKRLGLFSLPLQCTGEWVQASYGILLSYLATIKTNRRSRKFSGISHVNNELDIPQGVPVSCHFPVSPWASSSEPWHFSSENTGWKGSALATVCTHI